MPATRGISALGVDTRAVARIAQAADEAGFDAAWASEFYSRSAVVALAEFAHVTERCRIGSAISYAVGRSPMVLAADAQGLDELSGGRLVLGLGTGTRRMMSDWHGVDPESPAVRLEELVPLLRRIWRLGEGPIDHEGRFYRVRIRPSAAVAPMPRETIPVYTAGVNPRMVETAGRVADGYIGHPLFGVKYLEEVARPAIERGAERMERDPGDVEVVAMVVCSIHDDPEEARREAAMQIAFNASVKTYERVLDVSGFAKEGEAIRAAFRERDYAATVAGVTDDMIDTFSVTGTPDDVRAGLARYEGVADHLMLVPPAPGVSAERMEENLLALVRECAPESAGDRPAAH